MADELFSVAGQVVLVSGGSRGNRPCSGGRIRPARGPSRHHGSRSGDAGEDSNRDFDR